MLGNITGTDSQHKHGYSWQSPTKTSLVRPRSELDRDEEKKTGDQTTNHGTTINKKHSSSPGGGPSPAKKRRLNEEDLIAREELDSNDDDWEANDRFDVISHIGDGTYGVVYKAIDRDRHNQLVAVKKIRFQLDHHGHMPNCVVREIANLKYLHRYTDSFNVPIIRLLDAVACDGRHGREMVLHMVFEYMDQDLDSFIRCRRPFGLETELIKEIFSQIVKGVEWMHLHNIIHRDLKPQNILITDKTVKIADFGMSRTLEENGCLSTQVVTQWYRSPEVLLGSTYSKAVDIWSLGCIFAELVSGRPLFASKGKGDKWQLVEILKVLGTPPKKEWPSETPVLMDQFQVYPSHPWSRHIPTIRAKEEALLSKMLRFQSSKRPSASVLLRDEYFTTEAVDSSCPSVMSSMGSPSPFPSPSPSPVSCLVDDDSTTTDSERGVALS